MERTKRILHQAAFAIAVLLVFLLVFEQMVVVPGWLGPAGRMHPLLLHLPIGFVFALGLITLVKGDSQGLVRFESLLLHITVVLALVTALSGLFLQQGGDYNADSLMWHKWGGSLVALVGYACLLLYSSKTRSKFYNAGMLIWLVTILWAGHLGGEITHGKSFVFGTDEEEEMMAIDESTPVYTALVQPILQKKCVTCHRQGKAKADLIMETPEEILEGGKNGPIILAGDVRGSEMIRRVRLPKSDDEHMPPKSKSQLTPEEESILENWIAAGADFNAKLTAYQDSTVQAFFADKMSARYSSRAPAYRFEAADVAVVEALNTPFRTVTPLSIGSPALHATLFVRATYQPQLLRDLEQIKDQLVQLTLTNLPISDDDLSFIASFENLEKLILNGSDITGASLSELKRCTKLKSLGLSSLPLVPEYIAQLADFSTLRYVTLWNSGIDPRIVAADEFQHIDFEFGYQPDPSDTLKLSRPMLVNDKSILVKGEQVALKSMFAGVRTHFTLDGSDPTPDSPLYTEAFSINDGDVVKARAFKEGWAPSDIVAFTFYRRGLTPVSVELLSFPNPKYRAEGAATLFDGEKGQANGLRTPFWLGYREHPLEAMVFLDDEQEVARLTVSSAQNLSMWVVPPKSVTVWGGTEKDDLRQLASVYPLQPREGAATQDVPIEVKFEKGYYPFLKLKLEPVSSLPSWHQGAGQPAWVFTDEVLFYAD